MSSTAVRGISLAGLMIVAAVSICVVATRRCPAYDPTLLTEGQISKLLKVGMSRREVVKLFGNPSEQSSRRGITNAVTYHVATRFSPTNRFVAFTVLYAGDQVIRWSPVYRVPGDVVLPAYHDFRVVRDSVGLGAPRRTVQVYIASMKPIAGGQRLENLDFARVAWIQGKEDFLVPSFKALQECVEPWPNGAGKTFILRLLMHDKDTSRFREFQVQHEDNYAIVSCGKNLIDTLPLEAGLAVRYFEYQTTRPDDFEKMRLILAESVGSQLIER